MPKIFKYRPFTIFASIAFGFTFITNIIQLNIQLNGKFVLYPYLLIMVVACLLCTLGYLLLKPKLLGMSTGVWVLAILYNISIIIFALPIILLNIIGTKKMKSLLELDKKEKDE